MAFFLCGHHKGIHSPVASLWALKSHHWYRNSVHEDAPPSLPGPNIFREFFYFWKNEKPYFMVWTIFIPDCDWIGRKLNSSERIHHKRLWCALGGRHCSCSISVPCTGVSWDGTLMPANWAFPTEIQPPWRTEHGAHYYSFWEEWSSNCYFSIHCHMAAVLITELSSSTSLSLTGVFFSPEFHQNLM